MKPGIFSLPVEPRSDDLDGGFFNRKRGCYDLGKPTTSIYGFVELCTRFTRLNALNRGLQYFVANNNVHLCNFAWENPRFNDSIYGNSVGCISSKFNTCGWTDDGEEIPIIDVSKDNFIWAQPITANQGKRHPCVGMYVIYSTPGADQHRIILAGPHQYDPAPRFRNGIRQ